MENSRANIISILIETETSFQTVLVRSIESDYIITIIKITIMASEQIEQLKPMLYVMRLLLLPAIRLTNCISE